MSFRRETASAVVLLMLSLPACAWLAMRQVELRGDLDSARSRLEQERNKAAIATLNNIALPANAPLRFCNQGHDPAQITAIAGIYSALNGDLSIFNSARDQWRTWNVPAGAEVAFDMRNTGWNGQALFYAIDVTTAGKRQLLSGTSRELQAGCVNLSTQTEGVRQAHNH